MSWNISAQGGNALARALAVAGTGTRQPRGGHGMGYDVDPTTGMHEGLQHLVDAGLIAGAERPEEAENVGIEPQADSQLRFAHVEHQVGGPSGGPRRFRRGFDRWGGLRSRCARTRLRGRRTRFGLYSYVTALFRHVHPPTVFGAGWFQARTDYSSVNATNVASSFTRSCTHGCRYSQVNHRAMTSEQ